MNESFNLLIIGVLLISSLIIFIYTELTRHKLFRTEKKNREYRAIVTEALTALVNAVDAKDSYTSGHSARVAAYSSLIARRLGYDEDFTENLYYIGLLHDIGKIGIPSALINKKERLTDDEFDIMKKHTIIGRDILIEITTINNLTRGVSEHHEHWDGSGYFGKKGTDISLEARIIAAADAFDAMTSDRSYRGMLPLEAVMLEIENCGGKQFDPAVAYAVIEMIKSGSLNPYFTASAKPLKYPAKSASVPVWS